jgi:amidohydrolase
VSLADVATGGQPDLDSARQAIRTTIDGWADRLIELSHAIHDHPETAFQEHASAQAIAATLRDAGFQPSVGVYGLDTAIEAVSGTGEFTATVCAEYDALPGIGHGCGHNVIAAAAVGAAIGLTAVADAAGLRVKLLGTPAEEHGGGKVRMLEAGAWEDATISLMVHGAPGRDIRCEDASSQAVDRFDVAYTGRAAHSAAGPQAGINAGDAATVALVAIGLLRQQLPKSARVAAIIAEGGQATNIIPARAVVAAEVRAFSLDTLRDVKRRVLACFEAGSVATGCTWEVTPSQPRYANLVQEPLLAPAWDQALADLDRPTIPWPRATGGSTDMGNVSHEVPSIHPMIGLPGTDAPPHTVEFAAAARSADGDRAVVDAAIALAWTAVDAALDPAKRTGLLERQARRGPGATTVSQEDA